MQQSRFISLEHLEQFPHLLEALKRVKGYRTQEVGGVDEFVQIGMDAEKLKKDKRDAQDEEEIEEDNNDFVEPEDDKEKKSRKRWFATQIKRLAICMADFVYMTKFREHKIDHVIETKDSELVKKSTALEISRSGGARNPHVFQYTLRFLRSGGRRPSFARDNFFTSSQLFSRLLQE